ncbi:MAG: hypothetical protein ABSE80_12935 [Halobacteriota archaeon]
MRIVRPWMAHGFTARDKVNRIGVALHYGQTQRIATLAPHPRTGYEFGTVA